MNIPRAALVGIYLCAVALALLAGCAVEEKRTAQSDNPKFTVDVLGTAEGCTIYRFADDVAFHYFVRCESGQAATSETIRKNDHTGEIPTVTVPAPKVRIEYTDPHAPAVKTYGRL